MAFTSEEAVKIRHYLGYPYMFQFVNPRLEDAIVKVGENPEMVTLIQGLLTSIDNVFTKLESVGLLGAGVKSLDKGDVELYQDNQQIQGMKDIGRMYVNRLSDAMGVIIANDIFGTRGYGPETWKLNNAHNTIPVW